MSKITIYLDFDGVINVHGDNATDTAVIDIVNSMGKNVKRNIAWNQDNVDYLNELNETGLYRFVWHTTWNHEHNIDKAVEVIGFKGEYEKTTPVFDSDANNKREWTKWKADAIINDQAKNPSRFIWIDDKAPLFWDEYVIGRIKNPGTAIVPSSKTGITKENIITVIDWSAQHKQIFK